MLIQRKYTDIDITERDNGSWKITKKVNNIIEKNVVVPQELIFQYSDIVDQMIRAGYVEKQIRKK